LPWLKILEGEPRAEGVAFGRRLTMLLEMARVLGNSRDPEVVLQLVHAHTLELTQAERCLILLLQAEGTGWQVWPEGDGVSYSHSVVQQVLESHAPVCVVDTLQPGGWQPAQSVRNLHLRSVVAVPIAAGTTVHGVLYVDSRMALGAFGEDDVSMLEAIASQAAVALETTRLLLALRRQMDQQTAHIRLLAQKDTTISALRDYDRARLVAFEAESHDLRAPLGSVLVSAQGLLRGLEGELTPQQAGVVEGLLLNTRLLMARIDGILDVAGLESGKLSLRRVSLPLARVVREVLRALQPMAEAKALELRWDDATWDCLPPVWGDARRLSQVIQNLVDNAIKYTPTGCVDVSLAQGATGLVLVVQDTGPGFPEARIKSPFQRYGARDPNQHGSGLGLWRVAALVREHGGEIDVLCPASGGTRVTVQLPLFDEKLLPQA
jgi:signal transduction histidine kinase